MIWLGLDTSTPIASVALAVDDRLYERAEAVTTYSERLLPLIDELMKEANVTPAQLGGIACGAGPGSFTGLRIGLSTAKGLCLGTKAPLVLVSSLELLAARAPAGSRVLVAIDAFRGEVYAGLFEVDEHGAPTPRTPAEAAFSAKPQALAAMDVALVAGDGFVKHPDAIPAGATMLDGVVAPRARELVHVARRRHADNRLDDARTASPQYVRGSAPEERR